MFNAPERPLNVAGPEDPVVVRDTAFCLLLNVDQSVELRKPFCVEDACFT